jgi:DNA ligase 1
LIERKVALKKLLHQRRSRILYLDHVESDGRLLFDQIVMMDLEGIVCKRKDSPYKVTDKPSCHWIKVKNSRYSRLEGHRTSPPPWCEEDPPVFSAQDGSFDDLLRALRSGPCRSK